MKRLYFIIRQIIVILSGLIWGAVSFFWLGYSILSLGNFIEEPGSFDYEAEGEAMRIYGLTGCILYVIVFAVILFLLNKQKQYLFIFIISMVLGGIVPGIYIFIIRE